MNPEELEHLKTTARFLAAIAAAIFCIGFIGAWTEGPSFFLAFFGLPVVAITFLVGTLVWTARGLHLAGEADSAKERVAVALAAPIFAGLLLSFALPSLRAGNLAGTWTRLIGNRGTYDEIVRKARSQDEWQNETYQEFCGVKFVVDHGPPVRVAFNPTGILDNWAAIIFDPSGDVMKAEGFDRNGRFAAPDHVTNLFGGDLVGCRRLAWNYYSCTFT